MDDVLLPRLGDIWTRFVDVHPRRLAVHSDDQQFVPPVTVNVYDELVMRMPYLMGVDDVSLPRLREALPWLAPVHCPDFGAFLVPYASHDLGEAIAIHVAGSDSHTAKDNPTRNRAALGSRRTIPLILADDL
jgi:hypothetical protein